MMDDWASKNYEDLTNIERAEFHLSFDQYPMVQAFTAIAIARAAERQAAAMERIAAVLESVSGSWEGDGYIRTL